MSSPAELNIFIENICEELSLIDIHGLDLKTVIDDMKKMVNFFLSNPNWVEKSCLIEYQGKKYDTITFDIVLCDNEKIHEINKEYRNKDSATDVISFALFADSKPEERFIFDNEINLGEIIVSLEKTESQALENGKSFKDELYFLLAHGILHLMGYDHQCEESLAQMWDMQIKMATEVGIGTEIGGLNV